MALFRRRRREGDDTVGRRVIVTDDLGIDDVNDDVEELVEDDQVAQDAPAADLSDDAPTAPRAETGPLDRSEVGDEIGDRLDLGSLWLGAVGGAELKIEVDPATGEVAAVTTELGESAMQVQAFAAPRSSGIWRLIRGEIADGVTERGGAADERPGPLGTELLTRLPARGPDGRTAYQVMRFIGVDGPRWFLRAVITGAAASDEAAAEPFYDLIRRTVVVRGEDARPPREMLPLTLPREVLEAQAVGDQPAGQPHLDDLNPFERGPEITEIR